MSCIRSRAPSASSTLVRRVMRANRSFDTSPEKRLRSTLHKIGLRFRRNVRPEADVRCKADIIFPSARVCVFIDGCFWHGCSRHFRTPKKNADWWAEKIDDNRQRDRRQTHALRKRDWTVVRVWEHQLGRVDIAALARRIALLVARAEAINTPSRRRSARLRAKMPRTRRCPACRFHP